MVRVNRWTAIVVLVLALGGLASCIPGQVPQSAEAVVATWEARTDALLLEAGIEPEDATDEQRAEYGQKAADELVAEWDRPWYSDIGDAVLDWATVQGGIIGLLAAGGVAMRKDNRTITNLKGVLDGKVSTLKSLSALALGTKTPGAVETPATPGA